MGAAFAAFVEGFIIMLLEPRHVNDAVDKQQGGLRCQINL